MNASYQIYKIKVPPFSVIKSSVKAKNQSLIYQNEINDKYQNRKLKDIVDISINKTEKVEIENPIKFEKRYSNEQLIEFKEKTYPKIEKSFDSFWNKSILNYKFDNGIVFLSNNNNNNNNSKQLQTDWINEITNIQKNIKKRERKSLMTKNGGIDLSKSILFNRTKNSFQSKLY